MKNYLKYIAVLGLAAGLSACESDLEETVFNSSLAKPAVLENLDASYVLDAQKSDETVFTLNWTEPDMGYQAVVTNYVELGFAGEDFLPAKVLAAIGKGGKQSFTHGSLNNLLMKFVEDNGRELMKPIDFELRVASVISQAADTVYSNVIKTNITTYWGERQYPSIALRGVYNGWDFAKSQKVYSANEDNQYAAMVYFDGKGQEGWKFCEDAEWVVNWGLDGKEEMEKTPVTLKSGGDNIDIYAHNSYYLEFDKATGELKASQAYDSWGVVGDHNGWVSGDAKLTLASEVDRAGMTQYYLTTTMDMNAGNKWKIRPDEKWENDKGPGKVTLESEVAVDNGDGNFRVDADGSYTLKWYFNKVEQKLVVTKN